MNERLELLATRFFEKILQLCTARGRADYVVVTHLLEDRPWFLQAVSCLGDVVAVIPKRKSIVPRVRDILRHRYRLLNVDRSDFETAPKAADTLARLQCRHPLCLLDIGGYFASLTSADLSSFALRVAGIVEDTENGHVKYQAGLERGDCSFPIYSVARSELKRPENFLVGQSLVFSVEAILRQRDELLHGRRACVIGYGNIGRSVAWHLHERHVDVTVFDKDPMKLIEAFTHGFLTPSTIDDAVADADIIFCVTGNHSVAISELGRLKPFTYVATVTSPDDEFTMDLPQVDISHRQGHISELRFPDGKVIYLMNRGQAVNFVHGSVVGPFIQLLQAEILVTVSTLLTSPKPEGIGEIATDMKRAIAREWLSIYRH